MSTPTETVDLIDDETVGYVARAALLVALTGGLAQISLRIPFSPVPVSLQLFGVFLAGLVLGPAWGGFAIALYLLVGVVGAPVFSNGGAGLGYLLGPTGGYLVGFLLAAVLIGAVVHSGMEPRSLEAVSLPTVAVGLVLGLGAIYAFGVPWLAFTAGYGIEKAATVGMLLFLPGDALKVAATALLVRGGHLVR
jgi:biotin transport system substrate-specific component